MNKTSFISELTKQTGLPTEKAAMVNEILESNFIFKKKNTDKIVGEISEKLGLEKDRAKEIFDAAYNLIGNQIVSKLKHPFGGREE